MDNNAVAIAAIALTGTIATGFFTLIRQQNKVHEKVATAMDRVAESGDLQAKATKDGFAKLVGETAKGNSESKERNGHLGELIIQQGEMTKGIADTATANIVDTIQHIGTQHVAELTVDNSTVKNEVVEKQDIK